MKLFLASLGITDLLAPYFLNLLKDNRHSRKVPHGFIIENASDYKGKKGQAKLRQYYTILKKHGIAYDFLDLKKFKNNPDGLEKKINSADFIYISGGNTFYLYYWVVQSGLDKILAKQINNGLVYAGSSAGSIITGPTLRYLDQVDDITISPDQNSIKWNGLNFINFVILPHWGEEKYQKSFKIIKKSLEADGFMVKSLTNKQAFIVINQKIELIEEDH